MNSISLRALSSDPDRPGRLARERHEVSGREHGHVHGPEHGHDHVHGPAHEHGRVHGPEHGAGGAPAVHPSAIWWGLPARLGIAAALAVALWGVIGWALAGR